MKGKKRCVIFQWIVPDRDRGHTGMLIEQLRYAGLVKVVKQTGTLECTTYMLEIRAPHGLMDMVWADQNAKRMKSFGINAEDTWES